MEIENCILMLFVYLSLTFLNGSKSYLQELAEKF